MSPTPLPEFTDYQRNIVTAYLPGLEALVNKGASNKECTKWKTDTICKITNELFPSVEIDAGSSSLEAATIQGATRSLSKAEVDKVSATSFCATAL
ncbi:hypothetical protein NMY22_g15607 [Coprinellus aureogranulatus]|nr:hypothetical protein NMY22_g15607 [Coprinellus aureogranulatus]